MKSFIDGVFVWAGASWLLHEPFTWSDAMIWAILPGLMGWLAFSSIGVEKEK